MKRHEGGVGLRIRRSAVVRLPMLVIVIILVAGVASTLVPRGSAAPQLAGTVLPDRPAPDFALTDQWGHAQSLRQFRGRPVVLTFTQATCTQLCPVVAETIRRSIAELGTGGRRVAILAVSADPEHDSAAAIRNFLRHHGVLHRWYYLTGTRVRLRPVWQAYHLYVAPANAPPREAQAHTSATYVIDSAGNERVLMGGDPLSSDLRSDLAVFLGLPANLHGTFSVPAPEADHAAPALTLPSLTSRTISLASLRGKVVVINFWATWCTACQSEIPRLSRWYRQVQRRGVAVIGIDVQEDRAAVTAYVRTYHMSYPILLDRSGSISARYDVVGLPKSLIIDQQGVVQAVKLGQLSEKDLAVHAQSLLTPAR